MSRTESSRNEESIGRNETTGDTIPITRPFTPGLAKIESKIREILQSGMLTNGKYVRRFERTIADYMGTEEAVAVSSCTSGLIMTLRTLGLAGEILVPSFTFSATGHACYWAGLTPVFVDCDSRDWTISLSDCRRALSGAVKAILAVHLFGNPADINALQEFAGDHGLELIFDAAHAFGARYGGIRTGFGGHAEVFSLTPTKIATAGEGGIITTNDSSLARELRTFRNYGDGGDYDCRLLGFNGRMAEFNAILGLASLEHAEEEISIRNRLAGIYREELADVSGIQCQEVQRDNLSTYKDFTVVIDEHEFGCDRNELAERLAAHHIATKKYFYPPLHRQSAYRDRDFRKTELLNTENICRRSLTLPMYSALSEHNVQRICALIRETYPRRKELKDSEHLVEALTLPMEDH